MKLNNLDLPRCTRDRAHNGTGGIQGEALKRMLRIILTWSKLISHVATVSFRDPSLLLLASPHWPESRATHYQKSTAVSATTQACTNLVTWGASEATKRYYNRERITKKYSTKLRGRSRHLIREPRRLSKGSISALMWATAISNIENI